MAEQEAKQLTYQGSVKKDDWIEKSGVFQFVVPGYGWDGNRKKKYATLPQYLPGYSRYIYYSERDWVLLRTPEHEAMWANTIAVATTKAASLGFEIQGAIPARRKRAQSILNHASAGTFMGWVPFISAHIRSFLTVGRAHVEIERESKGPSSKIVALHHLNPLRCKLTDNPRYPLEYIDRRGQVHKLAYWQVLNFGDQIDATEGEQAWVQSAAERAYEHIAITEAIMKYLYEKVTGVRATSIEFIQGITSHSLRDALQSGDEDMRRRGAMIYKGVVAVPIPGDIPVQRVSIPLAEIPDGFDAQNIRDQATIVYAGATGMDVNDLDPRIAQRSQLGSGAQAMVLDRKTKGKGLVAWRNDWQNKMNFWVLDTATKFTWSEHDLDDDKKKADIDTAITNTTKTMLETKLVSPDQAKEYLVDKDVLPREYLADTERDGKVLPGGDKQTEDSPEAKAQEQTAQAAEKPEPEQTKEDMVDGQLGNAKKIFEKLKKETS